VEAERQLLVFTILDRFLDKLEGEAGEAGEDASLHGDF
jgi:hypothetical protein